MDSFKTLLRHSPGWCPKSGAAQLSTYKIANCKKNILEFCKNVTCLVSHLQLCLFQNYNFFKLELVLHKQIK